MADLPAPVDPLTDPTSLVTPDTAFAPALWPPRAWPLPSREALWTALGLVLLLEIVKDLAKIVAPAATVLYTVAAVAQLYYPLWRVGRLGLDGRAVGLDESRWRQDLSWALALCAITFVPFAIGHHYFWTAVFHLHFEFHWPPRIANVVLTHFLGVALPEEVFYRGFVQPWLKPAFARRWRIFGADCGLEIPLTAAIFALGHFAGEYDPLRLGPFFPGLLFGWLRARTGTVYGAVTYHAMSNILSEFLFACYR